MVTVEVPIIAPATVDTLSDSIALSMSCILPSLPIFPETFATLFVRNITDIEWDDISEAGPAVLAMIAMPFTYSISHGIALAFISYAAVKLVTFKFDTSPAIWVIAIASVVSFAI